MGHQQYMQKLKLDEHELFARRAFFDLNDEDLIRLKSLQEFANKYTVEITDELYELILGHPATKVFFPNEQIIHHVKTQQNKYFKGLFSGVCDLAYVEDRLRVGSIHEEIGMPPKWYMGAYRRYLQLIYDKLMKEFKEPEKVRDYYVSIQKIILFDMALAIDTYIAAHVQTLDRHKAAIRELSTPVIKVYSRVLLLPLVGTIDTMRAQQVMETVLSKVVEEQAQVIILDISGVPVVDTKVADHLLKTTAAVRLLGAQTILTGISANVAQTMVQLGVEIATMNTRTRLADGIELALRIVGKRVMEIESV